MIGQQPIRACTQAKKLNLLTYEQTHCNLAMSQSEISSSHLTNLTMQMVHGTKRIYLNSSFSHAQAQLLTVLP
jgi:uncharacterized protein YaeQ